MTLDSIINFMVGPVIICGVIWLFRDPMSRFGRWVKSFFDDKKDEGGGFTNGFGSIEYE